ncbi:mitochondria fission 1 protein [Wallemia mellicola]|uniref:Mitochondrial fission 1 protein n=2 Tax=Wallemia mellicola TaxID=1708541 RepID=A0A4T0MH49_9BASI|nr:mitochondria fission 1 protein [Wallemia mellicola CBS 633.66]TIB69948.1 hypothetical protein E3Q24_03228 [Wallemia mellicola]EIM22799.1 mitochondria fission 1 protein [Wallemia mellicola CBS 633.66]TIB72968.1 hypothetical protein E3Q23_03155 [Wallemia mellicola]TIB76575.1 mitochondria fission 1 protein [Wallemia mellicola]TIB82610.1 mitochondria fission 1 protein [Wallemia mellicola]|eukprot:XP_006957453.1 mitochondria fission 1 protein [Wallemia mellicola CBS 633.66]
MSSSDLPFAVDVNTPLSASELEVLRSQYDKEIQAGHLSVQTSFNLAWGLVKSKKKEEVLEGVSILSDIYKQEPFRRRECLYYLALGYYKVSNYQDAKKFNDLLLSKEPNNLQARSLNQLIDRAWAKEGYIGLAIGGGAVTLGALLIGSLLRHRR